MNENRQLKETEMPINIHDQHTSLGIATTFPSPLYVATPDKLTEHHLRFAYQQQLKETIHICTETLTYHSDSTVDPMTAVSDALSFFSACYLDSDLDAFRQWLTSTDDNGDAIHNYCSEGLCDWLYRQHAHFCADCASYLPKGD